MVKPKDLKHSNASVEIPCLMSNNVNVFTVIKQKNKIRSLPVNLFLLTIFTIKVAGITHYY